MVRGPSGMHLLHLQDVLWVMLRPEVTGRWDVRMCVWIYLECEGSVEPEEYLRYLQCLYVFICLFVFIYFYCWNFLCGRRES